MKVLLTGAHFTPAQAIIEELLSRSSVDSLQPSAKQLSDVSNKKTEDKLEIVYIGRATTIEGDNTPSVESQVLPKLGVKFIPITAGRVRRVVEFKTVLSLFKIPIGFIQSIFIVAKEKPDIVVSFGGYVGVPVVIAAWLLRIPVLIHEQTLVSGLANTVSSYFATKIAVTFDKNYDFPKSKTIVTGNPIRQEILIWKKTEPLEKVTEEYKQIIILAKKEKLPIILITGGNQGSHSINECVAEVLEELTKKAVVIHQTGDSSYNDFEKLIEKKKSLTKPDHYLVSKWISGFDMGYLFSVVDLAIARGGINTLLELALFSIPTIVIPIPYLHNNEQLVNAEFFKEKGLCQLIKQDNLTPLTFLKMIDASLEDISKAKAAANDAQSLVITDAVKRLTNTIVKLAQ